jgi:hypothetical protein
MAVHDARRYLLLFSSYYFVAYIPWGVYVPYVPLFFQRAARNSGFLGQSPSNFEYMRSAF